MARQKAFVLSPSPVQQYKKYDLENGPAEELRGPPEEFRYLYITKKRGGMQHVYYVICHLTVTLNVTPALSAILTVFSPFLRSGAAEEASCSTCALEMAESGQIANRVPMEGASPALIRQKQLKSLRMLNRCRRSPLPRHQNVSHMRQPLTHQKLSEEPSRIVPISSSCRHFPCLQIASAIFAASCALLIRKAFWDSTLSGPRYSLILPIM